MQRFTACSCKLATTSSSSQTVRIAGQSRGFATHVAAPAGSTSTQTARNVEQIRLEDIEHKARRGPSPLSEDLKDRAQTIHLPNLVFRLVRNGPKEKNNPFIATFRVPVQLTKPDIVSYLAQVYGLKTTSISTITEMGETIRRQPGTFKALSRKKATKKAIVEMEEPFWYPEPRSEKWLNDNFEKDKRKDALTSKLMSVGDGGPGRGRRSWRWRGAHPTKVGVGARYSAILSRIKERRDQQEQVVRNLVEKEKLSLQEQMKDMSVQ